MICSLSVALQISRSMHGELNHDGGSGVVWAHYISLGKWKITLEITIQTAKGI